MTRSFRALSAAAAMAFFAAAPALATFHLIYVKEVFPGTAAAPDAQYVMLQAYAAGQNLLGGHSVHVYDGAGVEVGTFTFSTSVANSASQMTVLIATSAAASFFGVTADLPMTASLPLAAGKVCWEALDCVAWGGYSGPSAGVGNPFNEPVGLPLGQAMRRRLDICGSASTLDSCDDTNDSANDFVPSDPAPQNNAGVMGTIPPSTCGNGVLESLEGCDDGNTAPGDGCSPVCRPETQFVQPQAIAVDPSAGGSSNGNGVFEPGETVAVEPTWVNAGASAVTLGGGTSSFSGPPGAAYGVSDWFSTYGSIPPGGAASCADTPDCYGLSLNAPASRPAAHWDTVFTEVLTNGGFHSWTLHVGASFPDVPTTNLFYRFIETLFHNGVTGGCGGGAYCPANSVTRAQMAVFLLKAKHGSSYVPPACTGIFPDVTCPGTFADWIEQLAAEGVTAGCGGGNYCPDAAVTRAQMAVFLLKALEGSAYDPPDCTGLFADVPCTPGTGFSDWIEDLSNRQITGGCGNGNYCPDSPNTRGQMAVFLDKTFDLHLYGP
jgi:cysteine-rich repeat protein